MTLFEFSILVGLAIVITLLVRIEKVLKNTLALHERRALESKVRDIMPNLWAEFWDCLIPWFDARNGPYALSLKQRWLWSSIAKDRIDGYEPGVIRQIPPDEIERLSSLSHELLDEADSSHLLLTQLEVEYLMFHIWNKHFGIPYPDPNKVSEFETELSNIRKRFLTQTERR